MRVYSGVNTPFSARSGERVALDWKANKTSDEYDIYLYVENVDSGEREQVLYQRGVEQNWDTLTVEVPFTGDNLRFSFLAGSYDQTGGQAIGSTLSIDNIRIFEPYAGMGVTTTGTAEGGETLTPENDAATVRAKDNYDLLSAEKAQLSIAASDYALGVLLAEQTKIGSFGYQMEQTATNLDTMQYNTTQARSRIEDADYAKESAALSRANILRSASHSMLAQANQRFQPVLSLLQQL